MLRVEKRLEIAALPRKILRPAAIMLLSALLTRADFLIGSPVAAALTAACLSRGEWVPAPVIGCLVGALRIPLYETDLIAAICCAAVLALEILLCALPVGRKWQGAQRACVTAAFGSLIPALICADLDMLATARAVAGALLAGGCAVYIESALRIRSGRTRLSSRERIGAAVLLGGCAAGLYRVLPEAAQGLAIFSALMLPKAAAVCACALVLSGAGADIAAAVCLCGAASAPEIYPHRRLRAPGVLCACGAMRLMIGAPDMIPAALACGAFAALGDAPCRRTAQLFSKSGVMDSAEALAREASLRASDRLRALGDAFDVLTEEMEGADSLPDEQELMCEMRARLCDGCSGYGACWMGSENRGARFLCRLIAEAAEKGDAPAGERVLYADGDVPPDVLRACRRGRIIPDRLGLLLADFARRRYELLMRGAGGTLLKNQMRASRDVLYALADRQSAPLRVRSGEANDICAALDGAGLRGCRVTAFEADARHIIVRRPDQPWSDAAICAARQAIDHAIGCDVCAHVRGDSARFALRSRLKLDVGASAQSADAGAPSGDNYMIRRVDSDRMALLLSDGMGIGAPAAGESGRALRVMWHLLRADIPAEIAAELANRDMLLCGGDEMFATLDLCIADLCACRAEIIKLAAARTVILRNGRAMRIEGAQLPMGILECARGDVQSLRIGSGDIIIMGSDGLMESLTDADILSAAQGNIAAQRMADQLVRIAAERKYRIDDITCICARVVV